MLRDLPQDNIILYAYAAERMAHPTYIMLHSGLYHARNGNTVIRVGQTQEVITLAGIYFFDAWRVQPCCEIPADLPTVVESLDDTMAASPPPSPRATPVKAREEEARDILDRANKNQPDEGPGTRKAAQRAYRYIQALTIQHGSLIEQVAAAAREHASKSKKTDADDKQRYMPQQSELRSVPPGLTAGLLLCLSTLPDPWPLAKITINMESANKWISSIGRLYFADECARHDPDDTPPPHVNVVDYIEKQILPELELRIIEFLAEWMVAVSMPARNVIETRAPHLKFMTSKAYWFRELFLGLKIAASMERQESFEKTIDGQVRCITAEQRQRGGNVTVNVSSKEVS